MTKSVFSLMVVMSALVFAPVYAGDIELVADGNFAEMSPDSFKQSWRPAGYAAKDDGNSLEFMTTNSGKGFIRVNAVSEDSERRHFIAQQKTEVQLNPEWTSFVLGAVYRVNEIEALPAGWQNFRFRVQWLDEQGNSIEVPSPFLFSTAVVSGEWITNEKVIEKPDGAVSCRIDFGSQGARLVADVAEVSLRPEGVSNEGDIPSLRSGKPDVDKAGESYAP